MKKHSVVSCLLAQVAFPLTVMAAGTDMRFEAIAAGNFAGTFLAAIPGDTSRLLMGTSSGRVLIVDVPGRRVLTTPLIQGVDANVNGGLNIAFHPSFGTNRTFFYLYTGQRLHLMRARLSTTDPYVIEPGSTTEVWSIAGTPAQHSGGICAFGPDGYLYVATGEGYGDPQRLDTWGGKVLRIDIDGPDNIVGNADDDEFPSDPNLNYAIPPDNPYVGTANVRAETVAQGLRNPYRGCFDPVTGDLIIADVGGFMTEELDVMPRGVWRLNFGWPRAEGPCSTAACSGFTNPTLWYPHSGGYISGSVIIGGIVYTGCAIPWLTGSYLFADNARNWLATARYEDGAFTHLRRRDSVELGGTGVNGIASFAQTEDGRLYAVSYFNGVYRLNAANARDCDMDGTPDSCGARGACMADFNGDCGVEVGDLLAYLDAYARGHISSDLDDGTGLGHVDGAVTVDDLLYFLDRYGAGC